ncbi:MAG: nitroreductase family protein [Gemmatimonadota bacterium]
MKQASDLALEQGRPAPTAVEIRPLIAARWSPRAIADRRVEPEKLRAVFEAARWAPSSFNEQPWRFLVGTVDEPEWIERLRDYLTSGNAWATRAPVLVASAFKTDFTQSGKPNRVALRDLGAAEENLFLQAYAEGLVMHQMAGFDNERLQRELLPDGFVAGTMFAIGYAGDRGVLSEKQQESERQPRKRKDLSELVFGREWGEAADLG